MKKFVKFIFKLVLILVVALVGLFFGKGYWGYLELTKDKSIDQAVSEVTSSPHYVGYEDISPDLIRATVAIEDRRFYEHGGVDYIGLVRACISQFDSSLLKSGGSTITQQLAKNLYGMFDTTWDRKSTEFYIAKYLEKHFTKNEIVALYVNVINYGNNYTGIYEASMGYLDTDPSELNVAQASLLAGIPQSPSNYDLVNHFQAAKQKQYAVLKAMAQCGYISKSDIDTYYNASVL